VVLVYLIFTCLTSHCDAGGRGFSGQTPPRRGPSYRCIFWDHWDRSIKHHCNGLLLVRGDTPSMNPYKCNPTTSRYARLPCPSRPWWHSIQGIFLAFDPAVSRHHQVFFLPMKNLFREEQLSETRKKCHKQKNQLVLLASPSPTLTCRQPRGLSKRCSTCKCSLHE
jgi:hypothetical protein